MSDESKPPDDDNDNASDLEQDGEAPEAPQPSHFFDDGLEEPPSMHAAMDRASLTIASNEPNESAPVDAPISFPLPIELSLFQGAPPPPLTELGVEDETEDAEGAEDARGGTVISLMPQVAATGAVWDLNPAGEETIRDAYEDGEETGPPDPHMLEGTIEALMFASDKPLTIKQLNSHMAEPGVAAVRESLYRIQSRFRRPGSGIRLVEVAKGWQFRTDMRTARYVAEMRGEQPVKLSKAALETLSIVSYRQPVTRAEVEDLRGVDPGGILRMLAERGLICVTGRKDEPGRPLLYGTTPEFLSLFGLRDLSDLPTLRDLRELQQDDGRDGIGGTDVASTLTDALSVSTPPAAPKPLVSVQEPLPLDGLEPID